MVGVEGGFRRQAFTAIATDDNLLLGGDLNANVITVNVVARFASGRAQPYVTGGVAFFSNDYSTDSSIAQQLAALNFVSGDLVDNTVGFNIAGGVDIQASETIGVFVEGRYFIATADTVSALTDTISMVTNSSPGEQVMNFLAINAGVRIFF